VKRVLWDVDTQVDFVHGDGKLAVPGSEAAVPAMARLVAWARAEGIPHVASADDHELTDPEISETPDYSGTFPPHCLRGTRGAEKIAETEQADPVPLGSTEVPERWLRGREFLLLKKHFDVFTNPNTDRLL
jgi:nicotinamidase/pyrazinamidase